MLCPLCLVCTSCKLPYAPFGPACLQMTAFAARLALDCYRVQGGHTDCLPCLQLISAQLHPTPPASAAPSGSNAFDAPGSESMTSQIEFSTQSPRLTASSANPNDLPEKVPPETAINADEVSNDPDAEAYTGGVRQQHPSASNGAGPGQNKAAQKPKAYGVSPALHWYMERVHAPLLAQSLVKVVVLAVFVGLATLSLAAIPHVSR